LNVLGKMGSIAGIRVSSTIGDKSNEGKNNKDVVQGEEGSRFLKKLRIFLCCMFWSSKGEASSRNKNNQANGNILYIFHHYFLEFTHVSLFN